MPPALRSGSTDSRMLGFTPALGPPGLYGKKATYTGAKRVESGAPLSQKPKPFTVKFTKAGTFTYYCNIHSGMKGTVKVVSKSHSVPSAKADAKTLKTQVSVGAEHGQCPDQDQGRGGQRQRRRVRPAWRRVLRDVPRDPDGPGRHHDQVLDVGQDLRGPHGDVRPRQPRDRADELPRRPGEPLRQRPGVPVAGRLPERSAAGRSGGPDPDAPRQRVLELRRSSTSTRRRRCRRRTQ